MGTIQVHSETSSATGKSKKLEPNGPVALISSFGSGGSVKREVSITYPKQRIIVTHKAWVNDGTRTADELTDEIMRFCTEHNTSNIQFVDRLLPMSEASTGKCEHCGGEMTRVPWSSE